MHKAQNRSYGPYECPITHIFRNGDGTGKEEGDKRGRGIEEEKCERRKWGKTEERRSVEMEKQWR